MTTDSSATDRHAIAADFLQWIIVARSLVGDHFPSERAEPHNQLVIDTARSLMLSARLGAIETTLKGLNAALSHSKES
ncbi:MAG: hypothetical protein IPL38_10940 [Rhodobacter sp.]|nr:hypothetical protein [Rhodobacter sp.]MBK8439971.1 hypothetical protein [Rhodobacter sp.]